MNTYPDAIDNLIHELTSLPGIGNRSAERITFALLSRSKKSILHLIDTLSAVATQVKRCDECFNFATQSLCPICSDQSRDHELICVVEHASDIRALESSHSFKGVYHVLSGRIAPLDGINPEDLTIESLIKRIKAKQRKEIVLATASDIDGETTALYLSKVLKQLGIKVSRIATGIPVGASLDYSDGMTLMKALQSRYVL